jgi:hypothetical protein
MAAAQELVTKQGASPNIFVTTDDGGVIDKVSYMAEEAKVFRFQKAPRRSLMRCPPFLMRLPGVSVCLD